MLVDNLVAYIIAVTRQTIIELQEKREKVIQEKSTV